MNIITITTFLPLIGAIALLLPAIFKSNQEGSEERLNEQYRLITLAVTVVTFLVSLGALFIFDRSIPGPQIVTKTPWIEMLGVNYYVGVDGISIWLMLLTTFLMPISVLASWHIEKR